MNTDTQTELIRAMTLPGMYSHPVEEVTHLQTHASHVFLAGEFAYKIKKPVDLGFLDYTDLDHRRIYCETEVRLNRRLTSGIYLGVDIITRDKGIWALNGPGEALEYAVHMKRLSDENTLASLLARNRLEDIHLDALADVLVWFYDSASVSEKISRYGMLSEIRKNIRDNFRWIGSCELAGQHSKTLSFIQQAAEVFMDKNKALFQSRVDHGFIREGHGDLKTVHVYFEDTVQILDCIDFKARYRCQDIAADLAVLALEMELGGYRPAALYLLSWYVRKTLDRDLMALVDFYKASRAIVQVKLLGHKAGKLDKDDPHRAAMVLDINRYVDLAHQYSMKLVRPTLWIVCGMIASGKSTLAKALSHLFSVPCFQSSQIRRQLFENAEIRDDQRAGQGMYTKQATDLVYNRMQEEAAAQLHSGNSVILDADFRHRRFRGQMMDLAADNKANIIFVECRCPENEIKNRLGKMEEKPGLDDARLSQFTTIQDEFEPFDDIPARMHLPVDTDRSISRIQETVLTGEYELLARQVAENHYFR